MIWIPNQLIGAAIGNPDVTLECITEAMPKAIAYWVFNGTMVMTAGRYKTHEHHHSNYKLDLHLHIKNIQEEDYGMYKCLSKNSHGDNEGSIQLYSELIFVPYARHYKPRLVFIFTHFSLRLRLIIQTIYVLKNGNSSFFKPKIRGL